MAYDDGTAVYRFCDDADHNDVDPIGYVQEVEWPHQNQRGQVVVARKFEARFEHEVLINSPIGTFPCFDTREEAVEYLANSQRPKPVDYF